MSAHADFDADVLVVGAGPAGLALGAALADAGLTVTLLEQQTLLALQDPPEDGREIALTHRARGVMERLGRRTCHLGFQSRSGPVQWMEPDTVALIDKLARDGAAGVLIVPVSFVSDHIETLQEIDFEYRMHAEKVGLPRFERAPSLNNHADFIQALASLVAHHLEQP